MPCIYIYNSILCHTDVYRFKGYYFECHSYFEPAPLNKNGEISKKTPKGFWDMIDEFNKLSLEEQEKYKI